MNTKKTILGVCGGLLLAGGGACLTTAFTSSPELEAHPTFQFEVPPYVMSCGYKVYKDPSVMEGRFWVAKSTLKNESETSLYDLEVACRIQGFTEWEHPRKYPEVLAGQTLTHCFYPKFPDTIINKTTRDRELIDVRIRYRPSEGSEIVEETRQLPFTLLGRNQLAYTDIPEEEVVTLADKYALTFFDACLVTPNDPIIRYLTQRIQQRMGGSTANSGRPEDIEKFLKAVYDTLADCGVRYGGTTGLPMEANGVNTIVQEVRLPREVITGTAGLCIELSNLFASICASEGLTAHIFFTSGHAWPAVRLHDGSFLPVESTLLGEKSYEEAKQHAWINTMAHLNGGYFEFQDADGKTLSHSITPMQNMDIKMIHDMGIRPVELPDSPDLRKRIDTLFDQVAAAERAVPAPLPQYQENVEVVHVNNDHDAQPVPAPTPQPQYSGQPVSNSLGLTINVPNGWNVQQRPLAQVPALELSAMANDNFGFELYSFPQTDNVDSAMKVLSKSAAPMGLSFRYEDQGVVPGTAFRQINGITCLHGSQALEWVGYFQGGKTGLSGVVFHANVGELSHYSKDIMSISQTIR